MTTRITLRTLAVAIAVLALADPAFLVTRHDRALVSVVHDGTPVDSALAARVARELDADYVVVRGRVGAADALVVVGERLPEAAASHRAPAFAVIGRTAPRLTIERVAVARTVTADAAAPVRVTVRARGFRGRVVEVTLNAGGSAVDRGSAAVVSDDDRLEIALGFVPSGAGATPLRVVARLDGSSGDSTVADVTTDATDHRWNVLFHDARPSWMSTFVRRAAERDPRMIVTSRTVTSTNVSTVAGPAPPRLEDPLVRERFDVIVIGAPDALSARDVAALDVFIRRRGGSVVLLLDARVPGPYDRLTGVTEWNGREAGGPVQVARPASADAGGTQPRTPIDTMMLRASELAWPVRLDGGGAALASDSGARPIVWSAPVGAGRIVVSGALDAWRFRDASLSSFDAFYTALIANEAAHAHPPVTVTVAPSTARPGDLVEVGVHLRDPAIAAAAGAVPAASWRVDAQLDGRPLRLVDGGSVGRLVAMVRAPQEGTYRATVRTAAGDASAPLVVRADAQMARGRERDVLDPWIASRGGVVLEEGDLSRLAPALRAAISPAARREPRHPMRSPWWIVPFALLLSAEWFLRRRSALP